VKQSGEAQPLFAMQSQNLDDVSAEKYQSAHFHPSYRPTKFEIAFSFRSIKITFGLHLLTVVKIII